MKNLLKNQKLKISIIDFYYMIYNYYFEYFRYSNLFFYCKSKLTQHDEKLMRNLKYIKFKSISNLF